MKSVNYQGLHFCLLKWNITKAACKRLLQQLAELVDFNLFSSEKKMSNSPWCKYGVSAWPIFEWKYAHKYLRQMSSITTTKGRAIFHLFAKGAWLKKKAVYCQQSILCAIFVVSEDCGVVQFMVLPVQHGSLSKHFKFLRNLLQQAYGPN